MNDYTDELHWMIHHIVHSITMMATDFRKNTREITVALTSDEYNMLVEMAAAYHPEEEE